MTETLTILLKITVVIFMAGNLLELGLRLNLREALRGLRDMRFVTHVPTTAYRLLLLEGSVFARGCCDCFAHGSAWRD
jgi:hypothetical protein